MNIYIHRPVVVTVFDVTAGGCDFEQHLLRPGTLLRVKGNLGGGLVEIDGLGWAELPRNAYAPAAPAVGCFSAN
jgi:hypothetical protein